jgi:hypothetical protein
MSKDLIEAAVALADMLAQENRALTALDLPRAVALLEDKHHATEAFLAARARVAAGMSAEQRHLAEQTAEHLCDLAAQNKRLLERAITVQSRVIGLLTRGVPGALIRAPRYTAGGALAQAQSMPPVSLSARV